MNETRSAAAGAEERRRRLMDVAGAILLALATVASTWCAYQSTLWGGVQTFRLAAVNRAGRLGSEKTVSAMQKRSFDASMFIEYAKAHGRGEKDVERFLYERFRPEMKKAVDAWLATRPLENPQAPPSPFHMPDYVQAEIADSQRLQRESAGFLGAAQQANEISDRYVLFTVVFSLVLFFGGIGQTFPSRRLQVGLLLVALTLFVATVVALAQTPLCRE